MKSYEISVPIVGVCYVTVEAETKEEALDLALDEACAVDEWEALRHVTRGNVWCSQYPSEATVDSATDMEEEG